MAAVLDYFVVEVVEELVRWLNTGGSVFRCIISDESILEEEIIKDSPD